MKGWRRDRSDFHRERDDILEEVGGDRQAAMNQVVDGKTRRNVVTPLHDHLARVESPGNCANSRPRMCAHYSQMDYSTVCIFGFPVAARR